jgi:hypothetical protein
LRFSHTVITDFGNIHIGQFENCMLFVDEDVGRFDVPVEDIDFVQALESFEALDGNVPDAGLLDKLFGGFVLLDVLAEIASFKEFSYQTEGCGDLIVERVHVSNDVRVVDRSEDANFVEAVGNLLFGEGLDLDSFEGVKFGVGSSLDFVD